MNVPSSSLPRDSMNISMMPVFLSKFILYFYNTEKLLMQKDYFQSIACAMLHLLRVCFCVPLTSPWWITLSLNTYSTFPLAEIFSACNQKRTLPFSISSTASSVFRGMTGEEGESINSVLNNIYCFGDLWQDGSCTEPRYKCSVFVLKRNVVTRHDAIDKLASNTSFMLKKLVLNLQSVTFLG